MRFLKSTSGNLFNLDHVASIFKEFDYLEDSPKFCSVSLKMINGDYGTIQDELTEEEANKSIEELYQLIKGN